MVKFHNGKFSKRSDFIMVNIRMVNDKRVSVKMVTFHNGQITSRPKYQFYTCILAKLPFIYYANFSPLSDHEQHINNLGEALMDVENTAKIQLGYLFFKFIFLMSFLKVVMNNFIH